MRLSRRSGVSVDGNGADPALVREVLRDVLAELLPELVAETRAPSLAPTSSAAIPAMPPPPVAAVHRPSSWGAARLRRATVVAHVEEVSLASDAELQAFVQRLLQRFENPCERAAIRSGAVRFSLRHGAAARRSASGARRIEHGAVTERIVREAAAAGGSLVLGPRAVLTPWR